MTTAASVRSAPLSAAALAWPAALRVLAVGVYLGVVLAKSEVATWRRVHAMFLFQEPHMYLIIGTAILVAMVSMALIRLARLRDVAGRPIQYKPKPYHRGVLIGGVLFGAGWAITGACPGPIYVQMGAGQWPAVLTFLGALAGMYAYAVLRPHLPH